MTSPIPVDRHIDEHVDARLDELKQVCAIPSVASEPAALRRCASFVADALAHRGFAVRRFDSYGAPIVYAEIGEGPKTLLFYNHYDVQPSGAPTLWTSPPFEPAIRDGALFARGAIDDKGELVSRLAAIDAVLASYAKPPCRMKVIVEGAEESGSRGLDSFIGAHKELLAADACIWEAGGIDASDRPTIALGLRGMLYVELRVRTMSRDAHSGDAHALPNAAWRLIRAVAALKDERERVSIAGFYDDVRPPSGAIAELLSKIPSPGPRWRSELGVRSFAGGRDDAALAAAVFSPTCNISGIASGYDGPGMKTVIPSEARCKIDFRLVPDQDPTAIAAAARMHLDAAGFEDVDLEVLDMTRPAMTDPHASIVGVAASAARDAWNAEPVVLPLMGGSGPMALFTEALEVPVVCIGCSYPGSRKHAPDEHVRIDDFVRGAKHVARAIERFATS